MSYSEWLSITRKCLYDARRRAEKKKLPFDLTLKKVRKVFPKTAQKCSCCKENFKGKGRMSGSSPTLDRICPSKGYVVQNLQLICNDCNLAKGNVETVQDLKRRITKLQKMVVIMRSAL